MTVCGHFQWMSLQMKEWIKMSLKLSDCISVSNLIPSFSWCVCQYLYAVMKEVTALVPVLRDTLYTMAVYTPERTKQRSPILLATPSHHDFSTWVKSPYEQHIWIKSISMWYKIHRRRVTGCFCLWSLQLSLLSKSCCESRGLGEHPSKQALWAVTCKGDVMVHEPSPTLEAPAQYLPCDHM